MKHTKERDESRLFLNIFINFCFLTRARLPIELSALSTPLTSCKIEEHLARARPGAPIKLRIRTSPSRQRSKPGISREQTADWLPQEIAPVPTVLKPDNTSKAQGISTL